MSKNKLNYLDDLEAEAIHILREVAGQFERPALLFSGGKDSITLVRLAEKAFRPGKFPFPLVHIDTGHNFAETITYRDEMIARIGEKLIVGYVQDSIDQGKVVEQKGKNASRNALKTYGYSPSVTGPSWMFGTTSAAKILACHPSILHTSAMLSPAMGN
jgi:sulfate adenylyltransferase subunit 2